MVTTRIQSDFHVLFIRCSTCLGPHFRFGFDSSCGLIATRRLRLSRSVSVDEKQDHGRDDSDDDQTDPDINCCDAHCVTPAPSEESPLRRLPIREVGQRNQFTTNSDESIVGNGSFDHRGACAALLKQPLLHGIESLFASGVGESCCVGIIATDRPLRTRSFLRFLRHVGLRMKSEEFHQTQRASVDFP